MAAERKLGLFLATTLVASSMVGSGIFLLPATLAGIGSLTTLAWILATMGALIIARVLAKLGRHQPLAGGPCTYAAHALGRAMGFQATAIYWLALWTGNSAIALAAIGYLASLFPALARTLPLALASIACVWILSAVNLLGPRRVCQLESASLFIGLIPVLLVGLAGWWWFHPGVFANGWNQSGEAAGWALAHSLAPTFWAFAGVESASIATALIRDPERNVARATYLGVILAAAVYLAACSAMLGMIPAAKLARSTAPFADAVRLLLGPAAAALVAVLALVKAVGSLAGWILLTLETGERGAQNGLFPAIFGRRWRGQLGPSLLIVGVLMSLGVVATVSPTLGEQFGELISVSVILSLLLYIYACLSVWHYARQAPAAFRGDRGYAAAGIAFCAAVILLAGVKLVLITALIVAATLALYPTLGRPRRVAADAE